LQNITRDFPETFSQLKISDLLGSPAVDSGLYFSRLGLGPSRLGLNGPNHITARNGFLQKHFLD